MLNLEFSTNPNGKLFQDMFIDIRLASQAYVEGVPVKIIFKGVTMGEAVIDEVKSMPCSHVDNLLSLLNCGRTSPYQRTLLSRYYNSGKPLDGATYFDALVLRWTSRDIAAQNPLIQQWWDEKQYSTT